MKKHSEIDWAKFVRLGQALVGKPYVFGAETDLRNPDPNAIKALDCSELVEWLFAQIDLDMPDGSYNQAKVCRRLNGGDQILIGDLAFKWIPDSKVIHHVGTVIDPQTILEAKGQAWGVILTPISAFMASSQFAFFSRQKDIEDA